MELVIATVINQILHTGERREEGRDASLNIIYLSTAVLYLTGLIIS